MESKYEFKNRYGSSIVLTEVRPNTYKLECKDDEFLRFGLLNYPQEGYFFVDPPGGPFMRIGSYKLDGKFLIKIFSEDGNTLLTFGELEELYHDYAVELNKMVTNLILKYAMENDIEFDTIHYTMSTTRDSLREGKWLPDTDACFEIKKDGETIGFNV